MTAIILRAPERITDSNRTEFRRALYNLYKTEAETIAVDFSATEIVSRLGASAAVGGLTIPQRATRRVQVFGLRPNLRVVFEYLRGAGSLHFVDTLPTDADEVLVPETDDEFPDERQRLWGEDLQIAPDTPLRIVVEQGQRGRNARLQYRGALIERKAARVFPESDPSGIGQLFFHLEVRSPELAATLRNETLGHLLAPLVTTTSVPVNWDWLGAAERKLTVDVIRGVSITCVFTVWADLGRWKKLWSMEEYRVEFARAIHNSSAGVFEAHLPEDLSDEVYVRTRTIDPSTRLSDLLDRCAPIFADAHHVAEQVLETGLHQDSLITHFRFPKEIRTSCEQYLIYFIDFLRDLGVEAEAELRHEAGDVLFSVTPAAGREALEKIHEALKVYLDIPARPDFEASMAGVQEPWMQALSANVYHLKGRLIQQASILQAKDAAIMQQQSTIASQQRTITTFQALLAQQEVRNAELQLLFSGEILKRSLVEVNPDSPPQPDEEPLLGTSVSVVPFEKGGLRVNLPQMLRGMKEWFAQDDLPPPGEWF